MRHERQRVGSWLNFEAGALSKAVETSRVVPLLLDLGLAELTWPLAMFQAVLATEDGIKGLVLSQQGMPPNPWTTRELQLPLSSGGPTYQSALRGVKGAADPPQPGKRDVGDMVAELLVDVRGLRRDLHDPLHDLVNIRELYPVGIRATQRFFPDGVRMRHRVYGLGTVLKSSMTQAGEEIVVKFDDAATKIFAVPEARSDLARVFIEPDDVVDTTSE